MPAVQRSAGCTLMICSWTPSSVCGPWKQLQMVSTSLSISLLPGVLLSGALPVMWPYAISFCHGKNGARVRAAEAEGGRSSSRIILWGVMHACFVLRCMCVGSEWRLCVLHHCENVRNREQSSYLCGYRCSFDQN